MSRGVPAGILISRLGGRVDREVSAVDCDGWIDFAASNWTVADWAGAVIDNKRTASNKARRLFTVILLPFESIGQDSYGKESAVETSGKFV